ADLVTGVQTCALPIFLSRSLQPVINATGVILHTNLGRAPLPEAVVDEFRRTATQYSNLEYDLEAGARGKRDVHTAELLTRLTGEIGRASCRETAYRRR